MRAPFFVVLCAGFGRQLGFIHRFFLYHLRLTFFVRNLHADPIVFALFTLRLQFLMVAIR